METIDKLKAMKQPIWLELTENVFPFWEKYSVNPRGGFYGARLNDLTICSDIPTSAIYVSRLLWTFSTLYLKFGNPLHLDLAQRAFNTIREAFWDPTYGGVYWSVNQDLQPVMDRKHHYAQAFAIYGLSAFYQATRDQKASQVLEELIGLLEKYAYDPQYGGYYESCNRQWQLLEDSRLSERDLNSKKSMNTLLHLLEAYTHVRRISDNERVAIQQEALLQVFLEKIFNPDSGHLSLFFDEQWHSMTQGVSYGHDIEASWLLWEAAEICGNKQLLEQTRTVTLTLADRVLKRGYEKRGFIHYDGTPDGPLFNEPISWWPQVEGMVGFMNAYQLNKEERYLQPVLTLWAFIQANFVDRKYGDWVKVLLPDLSPDDRVFKIGPWEGPYHHVRALLEMIQRIDSI